jgi:putative ABC transport system substrate-binding protein
LRKLGFTNGQNVVVEFRRIDEGVAKAFASANELAAARTNVLFAFGPELALQAAAAVRPPVPIVILAANYDPIARGYVKSLAHPGGNVTGFTVMMSETSAKSLELFKEVIPGLARVAVIWDPATPSHSLAWMP